MFFNMLCGGKYSFYRQCTRVIVKLVNDFFHLLNIPTFTNKSKLLQ